jgi:uncharacterized membrane protein YcfT
MSEDRVAWVQCAKGLTICLVVYGHAMYGVNSAVGLDPDFFRYCNDFFSVFRMPLFFFASGIFAARSISRPTDQFVNRTVLHFIYIYIVWCVIQYTFRVATGSVGNNEMDAAAILYIAYQPINVLWFIYVLLFFFVITRLLRPIPAFIILPIAGALSVTPLDTGSYSLDRFCNNYVFFLMGCYGSTVILEHAKRFTPTHAAFLVPLYSGVLLALIQGNLLHNNHNVWFLCSVGGIIAIAALCITLSELKLDRVFLYAGRYSLPIFVSHTIATAGTRVILSKLGISDPWLLLIGATAGGVALPVLLAISCDRLNFPWLFRKPDWFSISFSPTKPLAKVPQDLAR